MVTDNGGLDDALNHRLEIRSAAGKMSANLDLAISRGIIRPLPPRQVEELALYLVSLGWRKS